MGARSYPATGRNSHISGNPRPGESPNRASQILSRVWSFPAESQRICQPKATSHGYITQPGLGALAPIPRGSFLRKHAISEKTPCQIPCQQGVRPARPARIGAAPTRPCARSPTFGADRADTAVIPTLERLTRSDARLGALTLG